MDNFPVMPATPETSSWYPETGFPENPTSPELFIRIPPVPLNHGANTKFPVPADPALKIIALSLAETRLLNDPAPVVPGRVNMKRVESVRNNPSLLAVVRIFNAYPPALRSEVHVPTKTCPPLLMRNGVAISVDPSSAYVLM